jgi:signal transduction histidine kinase
MEDTLLPVATGGPDSGRAEVVANTLAMLRGTGEGPEELAHDARNMVTALLLYCDLLEEPGVLVTRFRHYAGELRLVAAASRRLVEKLAAFDLPVGFQVDSNSNSNSNPEHMAGGPIPGDRRNPARQWDAVPAEPIESLSAEVAAKQNLLSALAGPAMALEVRLHGGALPVRVSREDLTRVLFNLVKNAAEAMPGGGAIAVGLEEFHGPGSGAPWLVLSVEDTGPGIPAGEIELIFSPGYTTHPVIGSERPAGNRRGLGLAVTRSIVEGAGGRIVAANRPHGGARIAIELPVRQR